ncbi:MAG TPA: ABC transporter substrate-binding protein [Alphaproteobacteria bacterium]|nr:ABC transporter substrate-binding protein [Alphaproteobacteria bacterium]
MSRNVHLTVATTDYDHVRDLRLGDVRAEGIDLTWLTMDIHEIFSRFTLNREWQVSELSFAKFIAQATRDEPDIIGLPVYVSRMFRFSSFYVNRKAGISEPRDLAGKRIGVSEWAQTATVYMRGWLQHEIGVPLTSIDWYQAGTEEAGRDEKVELDLPQGLRLTPVPDKTLSGMLASGELDAVMVARQPKVFLQKHPDVARLFPDYLDVEERYFAASGVYPIMHVIALRRDVLRDNPWIARNLYLAFEESRRRSMARLKDTAGSLYPLPGVARHVDRLERRIGRDIFPYGLEANRATLDVFLQYAHEQGIAHRRVAPEDIFPRDIEMLVKV